MTNYTSLIDEVALQAAADWLVEAMAKGDKLMVNFGVGQIVEAYLKALPKKRPDSHLRNLLSWAQEELEANRPVLAMDHVREIRKHLEERCDI